jgi:hypothetical protein
MRNIVVKDTKQLEADINQYRNAAEFFFTDYANKDVKDNRVNILESDIAYAQENLGMDYAKAVDYATNRSLVMHKIMDVLREGVGGFLSDLGLTPGV